MFVLLAGGKHIVSKRQERDESHIVRHDHGPEICNKDKRERDTAHISECSDDLPRKPLKKTPLFQRIDNSQRTKKTGERIEIKIPRIVRIGRHKKTRHRRRNDGDKQYDVALDFVDKDLSDGMFVRLYNRFVHGGILYIPFPRKKQANPPLAAKFLHFYIPKQNRLKNDHSNPLISLTQEKISFFIISVRYQDSFIEIVIHVSVQAFHLKENDLSRSHAKSYFFR